MTECLESGAGHAVLMENFDKDYSVTEEEMLEYAREIGIDCETESNLLWIAWEGVMAPLPADWIAIEADDKVYYRNGTNGTTTWEHPCDSYYKKLVTNERKLKKEVATEESKQNHDTKEREEPQGAVSNTTLEEKKGATPKRNVHFVDSESVSEYDEWKRSNRRSSKGDSSDLEKISHLSKHESSVCSSSAREGSGTSERVSFVSKGERFDVSVERVFEESRNALRIQQAEDFKKYEEMLRVELKEKKERLANELQEVMDREKEEQEKILRCKMVEELEKLKLNVEDELMTTKERLENEHAAKVFALKKKMDEERNDIIRENTNEIRAMLRMLKETNDEIKKLLEEDARQLKEEYKTHLHNLRKEQREELERLSKEFAVRMKKDALRMDKNETNVSVSLQNSAIEDGSSSAILNLRISKMEACLERYQKRIEKLESLAEDDVSVSRINRNVSDGVRKRLSNEATEKTSDVSMISQKFQGFVDDKDDDNVFARMETRQRRLDYPFLESSSKDDKSESTTNSSTDENASSLESASATESFSVSRRFGSPSVPRFYGTNALTSYSAPPINFIHEFGHRNLAFYERYDREGISHYEGRNPSPFPSASYPKTDRKRFNLIPVTNTEDGLRRQKEWLKDFQK